MLEIKHRARKEFGVIYIVSLFKGHQITTKLHFMKKALTITIGVLCIVFTQAQDATHSVKRYSKVHDDSKYVITEYVYKDGHLENFITSLPVKEMRKMRFIDPVNKLSKNIEWDENLTLVGLQQGSAQTDAIENAFNNALSQTESQLSLNPGTLGKIHLNYDFLELEKERQSFVLINKVISALSEATVFEDLIPIEGIERKICNDSKSLALAKLKGEKSGANSAEKIGYENVEFSEHMNNSGIFLTNGEDELALTHIRAIYNWIFADQFTGWYNRNLILNKKKIDDYKSAGEEGLMGLGEIQGTLINTIVDNPTFKDAVSVVFQQVDPVKNSKYAFELIEIKPSLTAVVAADE